MTVFEFDLLTEDEKISVLWRQAQFIAERKESRYFIYLYQVASFYLEVWYSNNLIDIYKLNSFSNTDQLAPYLEQIDIGEAVNFK